MGSLLPGGWPALMAHNRMTALAARDRLCTALGVPPPAPDSMIGSLAALPVPEGFTPAGRDGERDALHTRALRSLRAGAAHLHLGGARMPDPPCLGPALQFRRGLRAAGGGAHRARERVPRRPGHDG